MKYPASIFPSKQPFHESLLLLLVKRGLTVTIDYGYFGFGSKGGDEGGDEVDVLFHWWVEMRLLLSMRWCRNSKIKLNHSCTKSWFFLSNLGVRSIGIMSQDYSDVFVVSNRLENYLAVHLNKKQYKRLLSQQKSIADSCG
jgi:hypothetical protein